MDKHIDLPVKCMLYPAIVFMVIGMTFGVFMAFNTFIFPDYFSGEYVHFGRVRPVHVSHVLLLWLLSANIGLMYYFVPRLCGIPLWSERMAIASVVLWWGSLIPSIYSLIGGTNTGWEYAELPLWLGFIPIKVTFIIAFLLIAINLYMTIANRKYEKMYVSLWYVMGTLFWTAFTYIVGNLVIDYIPFGISRINTNLFYVHNLVGLVFTPMGLATAYYFLPKISNVPIYSHKLSMAGFWSIAFVYAWIGAHHIIHGPVSQWLQTTSIVFSIWLFIPVFSVVTNLHNTLINNWQKFNESAALRFIMMGNVFYLLTCVQGPLMALRNVNEITSKTDWVIGHSHISLYGTFTFFAIAGVYQAIPVISKKPLWSKALADWHFSLNLWGSLFFILSLWVGGFWQGMLWADWANGSTYAEFHSNITNFSFLDTVVDMYWFWVARALGGLLVLCANLLFVFNIFNTIILQPKTVKSELDTGVMTA